MKTIITSLAIIAALSLKAQSIAYSQADSLSVIKLSTTNLDSNAVKKQFPDANISQQNFFSLTISEREQQLFFCGKDKNKWYAVSTPFKPSRIIDVRPVDIDEAGEPEIVVKGSIQQYEQGKSAGLDWVWIISLEKEPTQLFKAYTRCWEEKFGDPAKNFEGREHHSFERKISISEGGIVITPLPKNTHNFKACHLTDFSTGKYVLEDGHLILNKQ